MIRIVIAEDQQMVLGALTALLGLESDIQVVGTALDGEAALALTRAERPDVLIADIEMPKMTGIDVARQLQSDHSATQVLIVTTFARPGYLRRALEAGVRGYLRKDRPSSILAGAVRTLAGGGRAIDPELAEAVWGAPSSPLTDRECAILRLAEEGCPTRKIAATLGLSPGTVRNYLSLAVQKLGAANRVEAGRIARLAGWL
jgi:two-component system response regulator DesR